MLYNLLYDHTDGTIWIEGAQCALTPLDASFLSFFFSFYTSLDSKHSDSL